MDRLTYKIASEALKYDWKDNVALADLINRLGHYENTGLTPEQLLEIDKMYLEKCEEVNQLKEQLEVSREGDLISRKALLDRLNQSFQNINYHPDLGDPAEGMEQELFNEFLHDTIKLVKQQLVAYDVDKIVKQLESQIELKVTQYPIHGRYIKKNMAIEIVKAGGGNEKDII